VQEGFQEVKTSSRNWQQHANFWTQCWSLTRRSFTNMKRDIGYYWLRSIIYFLLSICLGTIYWRIGFQYSSILVSIFCLGLEPVQVTFYDLMTQSATQENQLPVCLLQMQIVAVACARFWGLWEKSVAVRLMSNLKDLILVQMGT
jgi:hypothetical protein